MTGNNDDYVKNKKAKKKLWQTELDKTVVQLVQTS